MYCCYHPSPSIMHLWSPWISASSAGRSESRVEELNFVAEKLTAPGGSSPIAGNPSKPEMRIFLCRWSGFSRQAEQKQFRFTHDATVSNEYFIGHVKLTDSKAMEIQCTRPPCIPTAPWDSCPGRRLGSGRDWHSGWRRGRMDVRLLPEWKGEKWHGGWE